jgi:hypothetical protein
MPANNRLFWQTIPVTAVLLLILAACNLPAGENQSIAALDPAQVIQVIQSSTPELAETDPAATPPVQSATGQAPNPTGDLTSIPDASRDLTASRQQNCNLAAAGNPIDITIPDDSLLEAKQAFTKIWRLENAGTCTWTEGYVLGHFSGDTLGAHTTVTLDQVVQPGESIELSIDMIAPENTGTYQSNWKLRNSSGEWFGIGPVGDAPIWVRIIVVPQTAAITATATVPSALVVNSGPSPVILVADSISLQPNDQIDLDRNQINPGAGTDLGYQVDPAGKHVLVPAADASLSIFSTKSPAYEDCLEAAPGNTPLVIEDLPVSSYLCFRTTEGSPGWLHLAGLNALNHSLYLDLITWQAP